MGQSEAPLFNSPKARRGAASQGSGAACGWVPSANRHFSRNRHCPAIRVPAAFALYNDAGIGIDEAGVSRLPVLDTMGVAAATVDAATARIGDARSMLAGGIVSRVNTLAAAAGVAPGMTVRAAVDHAGAPPPSVRTC